MALGDFKKARFDFKRKNECEFRGWASYKLATLLMFTWGRNYITRSSTCSWIRFQIFM